MAVGQYVFYGKPFIGRSPGANGAANTLAALIPLPAALPPADTCPCAGWSVAAGGGSQVIVREEQLRIRCRAVENSL